MFRIIALLFLCSLPFSASAQAASEDTLQLSRNLVSSNWGAMQKPIEAIKADLEGKLIQVGVTQDAAHLFSIEMQRAATQEALAQSIAVSLNNEFTPEEIQQIRTFIESPTGMKFQNFVNHPAALAGYFTPIIRQACDNTIPQVNGTDRLVVSVGYRQIQTRSQH